jgi:tyrosyl-tRNA synthetase
MVAGLSGGKMSSSEESMSPPPQVSMSISINTNGRIDSKIDLLDNADTVTKKIRKAEAFPKIVEGNGIVALVEFILLPAAALRGNKEFRVERRDAEPLVYTDIKQLQDDYTNDIVCSPMVYPDRELKIEY